MKPEEYPPAAFYFRVVFTDSPGEDTSFQELSGISAEVEYEEVAEGGENRYVHRLPKTVKHPLLSLKRGIADKDSPLVKWCKNVMEGDFAKCIMPRELKVFLMNEEHKPLRGWSFANAYPVRWEVESFESKKNEVAIEKVELSYTYSKRLL